METITFKLTHEDQDGTEYVEYYNSEEKAMENVDHVTNIMERPVRLVKITEEVLIK